MSNRIQCADLQIDEALHALLVNEIAPGTGIDPDHFWKGVADIWATLGPENQRLLAERDSLQAQIDSGIATIRARHLTPQLMKHFSGISATCTQSRSPSASPPTMSTQRLRRSPARSLSCL